MNEKPRKPNEKIFNKLLFQETIVSGLWISLVVFFTWTYLIKSLNFDVAIARGYVILLMVFIQNFHVFNCRNEIKSAFKIPFKNNYYIVAGIGLALLFQLLITNNQFLANILGTTAIPIKNILIILLLASPILFVMELFKFIKKRQQK